MKRSSKSFEKLFHSQERVAWIRGIGCVVCGLCPAENHHVKSRGAGGDYEKIIPLCFTHHQEIHNSGRKTFEKKYDLDLDLMAHIVATLWRVRER